MTDANPEQCLACGGSKDVPERLWVYPNREHISGRVFLVCADAFHDAPERCETRWSDDPEAGVDEVFPTAPETLTGAASEDMQTMLAGGLVHGTIEQCFWSVTTEPEFGAMGADHAGHVMRCVSTLVSLVRAESDARAKKAFTDGAEWCLGYMKRGHTILDIIAAIRARGEQP